LKLKPADLISVIVTTYNWPSALSLVLASLAAQTDKHFEVIVADDGSREETRERINYIAQDYPVPLIHHWQSDHGFRAAKARNCAIAKASGKYIIFIDGDCLVKPNFISRHRALAESTWFVAGHRVLLSQTFTENLLQSQAKIYLWGISQWCVAALKGHCNRWLPFLTLPLGFLRKLSPRKWQGVKTCNLAVWKTDLETVNGFDEAYEGWGYEDSDLVIRLLRIGVCRLGGRFSLPVIHCWHREQDRSQEADNLAKLKAICEATHTRAVLGLDKYVTSS